MKKFILLLIILSVLIIQCSNETSGENEKSKSETESIEDDADNFVYEKVETNIIKTNEMKTKIVPKENKKDEVKTETKINEAKTNEINDNKFMIEKEDMVLDFEYYQYYNGMKLTNKINMSY